jgi:hypothetical protein
MAGVGSIAYEARAQAMSGIIKRRSILGRETAPRHRLPLQRRGSQDGQGGASHLPFPSRLAVRRSELGIF